MIGDSKLIEVIESKDSEKLFNQPIKNDVSSLSIASLSFKKSIEDETNDIDLELPNDDFTENDFQIAWKKFCESEREKGNKENNVVLLTFHRRVYVICFHIFNM